MEFKLLAMSVVHDEPYLIFHNPSRALDPLTVHHIRYRKNLTLGERFHTG